MNPSTFVVYNLTAGPGILSWNYGTSSDAVNVSRALDEVLSIWGLNPGTYTIAVTQGTLMRLFSVSIPAADPVIRDLNTI